MAIYEEVLQRSTNETTLFLDHASTSFSFSKVLVGPEFIKIQGVVFPKKKSPGVPTYVGIKNRKGEESKGFLKGEQCRLLHLKGTRKSP